MCDRAAEVRRGLQQSWQCQAGQRGASADYTKAIELDPKQALAYLNRGLLLMLQGKEAEANKDFEQCLRISGGLKASLESRIKEIKRSLAI